MLSILVVLALQAAPIKFSGPDKAKPDDLKKAAAALQERLTGFGYQGISLSVSGSTVSVKSTEQITEKMAGRIEKLASLRGGPLKILLTRALTEAEWEQFPAPQDGAAGKAPPGMKWIATYGLLNNAKFWSCVYQAGEIPESEISVEWESATDARFAIGSGGKAVIEKAPKAGLQGMLVAHGDKLLTDNFTLDAGKACATASFEDKEIALVVRYPMPVALIRK
jgi:hypothetical protein